MTTPDAPKQSLNAAFKSVLTQPFRTRKPKTKHKAAVSLSTPPSSTHAPASPEVPESSEGVDPLAELPSFQYDSLDPTSKTIRLLEIVPGPDYEPIRVNVSTHNLDNKPSFVALSYMWDQNGFTRYLHCHNTNTRISAGAGLWDFLQMYRKRLYIVQCCKKSPAEPLPLWIDAVCINQRNLSERGHQVSLMRDIYTGADSVIVWLGLAQSTEELAFLLARYPQLIKTHDLSAALVTLLNKTYWSRVWVVQEFVLATAVEIWCGDYQADAASFESIWRDNSLLTEYPWVAHQLSSSRAWPLFKYRRDFRHTRKFKREVLGRRNSKTLKATFRLRDILQEFRLSQSSEVYDKIYGFLGIASDGRGGKIQPSYSRAPVELLVDVIRNQCHTGIKRSDRDDYSFLTSLMRTLRVSRLELAQHVLQICPDVQPHIYMMATSQFMKVSISFISTVLDVGNFVEHAEAFQESTWRTGWSRSAMHPKSLSSRDIHDLGRIVAHSETKLVLSFADAHVSGAQPGPSEKVRQAVIEDSTHAVIEGLLRPNDSSDSGQSDPTKELWSESDVRKMFYDSMDYAAEVHAAARNKLTRRNTDLRYERYTSFAGTNCITGLACIGPDVGAYEIKTGDRICIFSGVSDSNNAFFVRLDDNGKWVISGFAIIMLPETIVRPVRRADTETTAVDDEASTLSRQPTWTNDTSMCFHCHLTDLMELQRCRILNKIQMDNILGLTLRGNRDDDVHCCSPEAEESDVLEFGL